MPFYVGDIPAEPFVIEPPDSINLAEFDTVDATLALPTGGVDPEPTGTIVDGTIVVQFPTDVSLFDAAGVYRLVVRIEGVPGALLLPSIPLVVQPAVPDGWHTLDSIRAEWPDAEYLPDVTLAELLEVAKLQCVEFAPALEEDAKVPTHYRMGQRVQARNLWNATKVAPDGTTGEGDFVIRPFPLDWHVKSILRPKRGIPVVG